MSLRGTASIATALSLGFLLNVSRRPLERRAERRRGDRVRIDGHLLRVEGATEIVLRAVDTAGNRSAPSNAIMFDC